MSSSLELTDPLARRLAEIAAAGVALPEGLQAAAEEVDSRRLRRALRQLADDMRRGATPGSDSPDSLERLTATLVAGSHGDVAGALVALEEADTQASRLRRQLHIAWSYPAVILLLAAACGLVVLETTSVAYADLFDEFELERNAGVEIYLLYYRFLLGGLAAVIAMIMGMAMGSRLLRAAWLDRLYWRVPLVGSAERWLDLSVICATMAQLLASSVPYGDALRLCQASIRSAALRRWLRLAATDLEQGQSIEFALVRLEKHAEVLPALVGSTAAAAVDPASTWKLAQQYFAQRATDRVRLVRAVVPVIGYLLIVAVAFSVLQASLAPLGDMAELITGLGG